MCATCRTLVPPSLKTTRTHAQVTLTRSGEPKGTSGVYKGKEDNDRSNIDKQTQRSQFVVYTLLYRSLLLSRPLKPTINMATRKAHLVVYFTAFQSTVQTLTVQTLTTTNNRKLVAPKLSNPGCTTTHSDVTKILLLLKTNKAAVCHKKRLQSCSVKMRFPLLPGTRTVTRAGLARCCCACLWDAANQSACSCRRLLSRAIDRSVAAAAFRPLFRWPSAVQLE